MRTIFLMIVAFMLLIPGFAEAENRALIIGVGKYRIENASLPGIEQDVENMVKIAQQIGFTGNQIKVLRDADATLVNIENAINTWLIQGVKPSDRVLIYFSGHGSYIPDENGDEDDETDEVLLPYDTEQTEKGLKNALVDDRFGELLAKIPSKEVFVLIDACHSGSSTKSVDRNRQEYPKFFQYPNMPTPTVRKGSFARKEAVKAVNHVSLTACRDDETAIATSKGSLFTRGILAAIETALSLSQSLNLTTLIEGAARFITQNVSNPSKIHHPTVSGNTTLAQQNLLEEDMAKKLEQLADKADFPISVKTNKQNFKVGELLEVSCQPDRDGYLNVLNINPQDKQIIVLFPNKYHTDNFVKAGTTTTIPAREDKFDLPASPPLGKTLIVVFLTQKPVNAYKEGEGKPDEMFRTFSNASFDSLKGFAPREKKEEKGLGAGKVVIHIE